MKRYLLDLSALYSDHRQKAFIGYRTSWCTVGCLIRSIRDTFQIETDLYVCSEEGIFYPESESIDLIYDGESLKILPKVCTGRKRSSSVSNNESREQNVTTLQQESSAFEDIETVLLGLPKPKRRRVRKRKEKRIAEEEKPSQPLLREQPKQPKQSTPGTEQNGHVRFTEEESESCEEQAVNELELPYRNLNHTMKARVVRAVSPSTFARQSSDNATHESLSPTEASVEESHNTKPTGGNTNPSLKPRIVRALRPENTVEVKREQLEANHAKAALQQSYQPQTAVEDDAVIELDSPTLTPVRGEEATHDTAIAAV